MSSPAIDFEMDERGLSVSETDLKTLAHLCAMQVGLEARIDELNQEIELRSAELRKISEQDIPTLMEQLGVRQFGLHDGTNIEIQDGVTANIKDENRARAYKWLEQHGHGDLIKTTATISFDRAEKEKADKFILWALNKKLKLVSKQAVHGGTLKSFVKEELRKEYEGGVKKKDYLPRDLFGVFEYKKTKVVLPK